MKGHLDQNSGSRKYENLSFKEQKETYNKLY